MNPIESDAMWNRYTSNGRTHEGIAIRTTFKQFKNSFDAAEKYIGQVFYMDNLWTTVMQKNAIHDDRSRQLERGAFRYAFGDLAAEKWRECCELIILFPFIPIYFKFY